MKERFIAIGDIHGRANWKLIVHKEKFDKVIFAGDYFDTRDGITPTEQKKNFREICQFKRDNPNKVTLLFGNHDYHYLASTEDRYSGYQPEQRFDIQQLLQNAINEKHLQMCFVWKNILFSHAGVTQTWCQNTAIYNYQPKKLQENINDLFYYKPLAFRFTIGQNRDNYGDDVTQSPIWVRPASLLKDKIKGFVQVVGHTSQDKLVITDDVILIDTLGTSGEYLIYEAGTFTTNSIR